MIIKKMKTFEFLIYEGFSTSFTIKAETEEKAKEHFLSHGYDEKSDEQDVNRELVDWQLESIEEQK